MTPSAVSYASGRGTVVVAGSAVCLVDSGPTSTFVSRLWDVLDRGGDFAPIVGSLLSVGFDGLPPFCLIVAEPDAVRILHRGDIELTLVDGAGVEYGSSASGVTTWREDRKVGITGARMALPGEPGPDGFALGHGTAPAARLVWGQVPPDKPTSYAPPLPESQDAVAPAPERRAEIVWTSPAPEAPERDAVIGVDPVVTPSPSVEPLVVASDSPSDPPPIRWLPADTDTDTDNDADDTAADADAADAADHADAVEGVEDDRADGTVVRRSGAPGHAGVASDGLIASPSRWLGSEDGPTAVLLPEDETWSGDLTADRSSLAPIDEDDPDHDGMTVIRPRKATPGVPVTAPSGTLRFSTGEVIELDRPIVIGRQPDASPIRGVNPRTVTIDNVELSRTHVIIDIAGTAPTIVDNGSTNGTSLIRPDSPELILEHARPEALPVGSVVNLGGVVTLRLDAR